jgi:pimeloyl-ACP methyl ester carboxylesterase
MVASFTASYGSPFHPKSSAIRTLRPLLLLLLALAPLATPARGREVLAAAAESAAVFSPLAPHLVLPPSPIPATDDFVWNIRVRVVNPTDRGIFLDSLRLDITDLYVASRRRGKTQSFTVAKGITDILKGVSPSDSGFMTYSGPAYSERAQVTMRLYSHLTDGKSVVTPEASVEMGPPNVSVRYPPILLDTKQGKLEYSFVPELWPTRASPAILIVHGEDGQARDWLPLAWNLANHGYSCMLMSLPGYGFSAGPPDFAGTRSVAATSLLLDRLRRSVNVDSNRVAVWGISEGATVAALAAAKRKDLAAVILESGLYDLPGTVKDTRSEGLRQIVEAEAGPKSGWKSRSPLLIKALPSAPTLILHGGKDDAVPPSQASAYAALFPAKSRSTLQLFPEEGHRLPIVAARDSVLGFLQKRLPPPPPPRQQP